MDHIIPEGLDSPFIQTLFSKPLGNHQLGLPFTGILRIPFAFPWGLILNEGPHGSLFLDGLPCFPGVYLPVVSSS